MDGPNIVVILVDTLRADHLSCYGYHRETTPFMDRIAERGALYESAYSSSIWTAPAYGTFFTGELPSEHGAISWEDSIDNNRLVNHLNDAGYNTFGVSPHYLLGHNGAAPSFDSVERVRIGSRDLLIEDDPVLEQARAVSRGEGWDSRFGMLTDLGKLFVSNRSLRTVPNAFYYVYQKLRNRFGFWADSGAQQVLAETDRILAEAEAPYFLFLNFIEPHGPYRPPRTFASRYAQQTSVSKINGAVDIDLASAVAGETDISTDQRELLIDLYDAEIRYLDAQLEQYLEPHLESLDDMVVVLLSDHGEAFGEWGLWGHERRIHNNVARVPLLVSHPEIENERFEDVIGLPEVTEYLLQIADGKPSPPVPTPSGEAFLEYYGWDTQKLRPPWETYSSVKQSECVDYQVSYASSEYKFWWSSSGDTYLSDRLADPEERNDISPDHPEVVTSFKKRIRERIGNPADIQSSFRKSHRDGELDPRVAAHLDQLGYR